MKHVEEFQHISSNKELWCLYQTLGSMVDSLDSALHDQSLYELVRGDQMFMELQWSLLMSLDEELV